MVRVLNPRTELKRRYYMNDAYASIRISISFKATSIFQYT